MKAIKDNKVYTVDETSKGDYLARGFDIYSDDGKLVERSPSSTVSRKEYDALLAKIAALQAENAKLKAVKSEENTQPKEETQKKAKGKSGGEG